MSLKDDPAAAGKVASQRRGYFRFTNREAGMDDAEKLIPILANPLAISATAVAVVWRIARWVGPIVEKLVARHIQFMESIELSQGKIQEAIVQNTQATNDMRIEMRDLRKKLEPVASKP